MKRPEVPSPPQLTDLILDWALPRDPAGRSVLGDLREEFGHRYAESRSAARRWYRRQALGMAIGFLRLRLVEGSLARSRESFTRSWRRLDMGLLLQDLRYGARALVRSPGFSLVALLVLTLGVGATTAIFSVVDGVLLKSLPYPEAERLVSVLQLDREHGVQDGNFSPQDFEDLAGAQSSFASIAQYWNTPGQTIVNLLGDGPPLRLEGTYVGAEFFATLGVPALLGRTFARDEVVPGEDGVVVLSHELWQSRFGGDPEVVGSTVSVAANSMTVVGIMPESFRFPHSDVRLWLPISLIGESSIPSRRSVRWLTAVARLGEDVALAAAQAETDGILARLAAEYPDSNEGWDRGRVIRLRDSLVGDVRPAVLVLFAATGIILLIVCANVGTLLLTRATARRREIAIRVSLGAGPTRLVGQVMTESVLLAVVGGALGLASARWGVRALMSASAGSIPLSETIAADGRVAFFALVASLTTGLLFGLLPAWRMAHLQPAEALQDSSSRTSGRGMRDKGKVFVVVQTSLAVMLVIGSGLMIRSMTNMLRIDPGFEPERAITVALQVPADIGSGENGLRDIVLYRRRIIDAVAAVPGVIAVGGAKTQPLDGGGEPFSFGLPREDGSVIMVTPQSGGHLVTPGYFEALGMELLAGRTFRMNDEDPILVINESLASSLWPDESAVGQRLWANSETSAEIVGVVRDVHHSGLLSAAPTAAYLPDYLGPRVALTMIIRVQGDASALADQVRAAVWSVNPEQAMTEVRSLTDVVRDETARSRFVTSLLVAFAGLALTLAMLGLYGVTSQAVGNRADELGLRRALGAEAGDIVRMVVGSSLRTTLLGLALGVVGALGLSRLLAGLLFGVEPADPLTFAVVCALVILVSLAASARPTMRALQVDPARAMRA